ncbi:transducin/WD40 repeat-like superfamily protein [Striga asiatica]|uniref:Transducin/WD40 repeat-like superfamily protein n=1 Tax=Striga asiatica TaxID=4170 RepID=A0A5A7RE17_STRAF|nr:transducin/WD40 repeat-like superfamily protein [Striga asiatica]
MEQFENQELEYVDYYEISDFDDDNVPCRVSLDDDNMDSDFEDDLELGKPKTDTSASEVRNGKDMQGIPWERLNFTREKYRESRLKGYKNFENLSISHGDLEKDCKEVDKGHKFYVFQFNTRLVKSTIVHFQFNPRHGIAIAFFILALEAELQFFLSSWWIMDHFHMLRNLLWATSKHDVYLTQNYSVMHWSSLLRRGKEVLNVAKPIVSSLKNPGCLTQPLSRVQISTMTVKENLMVAGGFQGEVICKYLHQPDVAFCTKLSADENAITNAVDIYHNPSGALRVMTGNNDAQVQVMDTVKFACLDRFTFPWSVNNTSVSPGGQMVAVLGDNPDCLIVDAQSGKVISILKGHLDYSFASDWRPDGQILATGNQDKTCRLWDVRKLSESLAVLKGRMGAIRNIKFTSDGQFMAMAEPADFVHVFDVSSDYRSSQEIDLFGEIAGISFSPDKEALFVGISDRTYGSLLEFNLRHFDRYLESVF